MAGESAEGILALEAWLSLASVVSIGTNFFISLIFLAFLFSASSFALLLYSAQAGLKMVSGIELHAPAPSLICSSGHFLFLIQTHVCRFGCLSLHRRLIFCRVLCLLRTYLGMSGATEKVGPLLLTALNCLMCSKIITL